MTTKTIRNLLLGVLLCAALLACGKQKEDTTDTSTTPAIPTLPPDTTTQTVTTTAPPPETTTAHTVHTYKDKVFPPTCIEQGYTRHTCTVCGESYIDSYTETAPHVYLEDIVDPTCTEQGYTKHTCYYCGDSYTDTPVEPTGHHYIHEVIYPTGTEQGYTEYSCIYCDYTYRDNYTDPVKRQVIVMFDRQGGVMEGYDTRIYPTGEYAELPIPTREGYTFDGWYDEETLVESGIWSIPDSVRLVAHWTANTYNISFDPNGGTMGYPYGRITYDTAFGSLMQPNDRFGYLFEGWYLGEELITPDTVFTGLSDITLVARWKEPYGSGTAGENLTWTLCADGVLRFSGEGTAIAEGAFAGRTDITQIELPETLTDIGAGAFEDCTALRYVSIPGSVEVIRSDLFAGCSSLEEVVLGSGMFVLNEGAFRGCSSLTTITVPLSLLQIFDPFGGCTALATVRYEGTAFQWSVVVKDTAAQAALAPLTYEYETPYPKKES